MVRVGAKDRLHEKDLPRYLGARHSLEVVDPKNPDGARELATDMDNDFADAVTKFEAEYTGKPSKVASPYLPPEEIAMVGSSPGVFSSCASYVATLLFLCRFARPDVSTAVQRLCRVVSKWTTTHDIILVRLFAYLKCAGPMALTASLGRCDLQSCQLLL